MLVNVFLKKSVLQIFNFFYLEIADGRAGELHGEGS